MAESKDKLKSLLMKVKKESEKAGLKVSIQKTKIMASGPISSVSSAGQLCPLFVTLWTAARQASLFITNSQSLLKLMSIKSVMPSNHCLLCRPLLLLPSIFAINVVSSAYLRLWIFLPAILIPACASSSLAFYMMYSAYKLNSWVTKYSLNVFLSQF